MKKVKYAVLCTIILLSACKTLKSNRQLVEDYLDEGDYYHNIEVANTMIEEDPNNALAYLLRGE
jgi:hypothetical protein